MEFLVLYFIVIVVDIIVVYDKHLFIQKKKKKRESHTTCVLLFGVLNYFSQLFSNSISLCLLLLYVSNVRLPMSWACVCVCLLVVIFRKDITASQTSSDIILLQPHQRQQQQQQQHLNAAAKTSGIGVEHRSKRHTARSISECVDIDYVDEDGTPASSSAMTANANSSNKNADADDDDDDDGDFTTLSEMNDDSQHTQPSLLGNIDFTTKTSSSVINETISGLVDGSAASKIQQRHQGDVGSGAGGGVSATDDGDRQKFLVNFSSDDEKSTQLCNTDNESLNSIEFKADISRGLVVQGVHSNSDYNNDDDQQQQGKAEETSKSSSTDAFTTFFNNFNAGK